MKSNIKEKQDARNTKKKYWSKKRVAWYVTIPIIALLLAGSIYGFFLVNKAKEVTAQAYSPLEKSDRRNEAVKPLTDHISILIMGVDESEKRASAYGEAIRTDALMLLTLNKDDKSMKLLSIPRDTRVYIDSRKRMDKITHAHVFGGVESTVKTVEEFLDIPVDYYVKFNFNSFIEIVDSLGGIDVDVPVSFTEQDSNDKQGAIKIEKGYQHLNGEQALALARTRHIDSDMMRGQRQQLVLEAILQKALSVQSINKLPDLLDAIAGNFTTNLTFDDMYTIAKNMALAPLQLEKLQVEGEDKYIDHIYYYQPVMDSVLTVSNTLRQHIGLDPTTLANLMKNRNDKIVEKKPTKTPPPAKESGKTNKPDDKPENNTETKPETKPEITPTPDPKPEVTPDPGNENGQSPSPSISPSPKPTNKPDENSGINTWSTSSPVPLQENQTNGSTDVSPSPVPDSNKANQ
jgi:polyisoprenyl-teichoic acid--peptidoglycan teichoic acid transferase